MSLEQATKDKISETIGSNPVVLYMKGTPTQPQCGFSATVVQILDGLGAEYATVDVLSDPAIRDGIKQFSNWPTIPQLYIAGEFTGGCDIVKDMFDSGDLQKALNIDVEAIEPPAITITPSAAEALKGTLESNAGQSLHLAIDPKFNASLQLGETAGNKLAASDNGVVIYVDFASAKRAEGMTIDFIEGPEGSGFKIDNPNAPPPVHQMDVASLKKLFDDQQAFQLLDCRTTEERETATIAGSVHLTEEVSRQLSDVKAMLVFHCHHGGRSQRAAEYFRDQGFQNVHNVVGGIDAWSQEIDSDVPRY